MTFWNLAKLEPTRRFRFQIQTPGGWTEKAAWMHAKTIDKPSYDINIGEYLIGNQKIKYPGVVTWNDVNLTAVDTGKKTKGLYQNLENLGWSEPSSINGLRKEEITGTTACTVVIHQLNAKGSIIEIWTLHNALFKTVNFGQLSYSDDELVEIQITVSYDFATLEEVNEGLDLTDSGTGGIIGAVNDNNN